MTRKHYRLLAAALAATRPERRDSRNGTNPVYAQWRADVLLIMDTLEVDGGFDLNGNRRFSRERFAVAAGLVPA